MIWDGTSSLSKGIMKAESTVVQNGAAQAVILAIVDLISQVFLGEKPAVVRNSSTELSLYNIRSRKSRFIENENVVVVCSSLIHNANRACEPSLYSFMDANFSTVIIVARVIKLSKSNYSTEDRHGRFIKSKIRHVMTGREDKRIVPRGSGISVKQSTDIRISLTTSIRHSGRDNLTRGSKPVQRGTDLSVRPSALPEILRGRKLKAYRILRDCHTK